MIDATKFHEHLDKCERCMNQPFNLCIEGQRLMQAAIKDVPKPMTIEQAVRRVRLG